MKRLICKLFGHRYIPKKTRVKTWLFGHMDEFHVDTLVCERCNYVFKRTKP